MHMSPRKMKRVDKLIRGTLVEWMAWLNELTVSTEPIKCVQWLALSKVEEIYPEAETIFVGRRQTPAMIQNDSRKLCCAAVWEYFVSVQQGLHEIFTRTFSSI